AVAKPQPRRVDGAAGGRGARPRRGPDRRRRDDRRAVDGARPPHPAPAGILGDRRLGAWPRSALVPARAVAARQPPRPGPELLALGA
ncbi:hypothetical protein DF186_18915, partial [Enterococcus hirae]